VLVIDAAAAVRDVLQHVLGKDEFRVVSASGGQKGPRLARELRPKAINLDVTLPDMEWWEVLSALNGQL
jgi:DNA-binding response OmpR family regulator